MESNRKNFARRKPKRMAPCGFIHDFDPFFLGLAAAEFMPADPAIWFDAACAARMSFARQGARIIFPVADSRADGATDFLRGLLFGTPGADQAVSSWMRARGFEAIKDGADGVLVERSHIAKG